MLLVFTGGGTLGPVTPLIAVRDAVRTLRPDADFAWIGTEGGPEDAVVRGAGIAFHAIPSGKFRRYASVENLTDLWRIVLGFSAARRVLKELRPSVVVSAGGYVAVPVAYAAWTLGIPVHVHQQDVVPGLANKLTLPVARSLSVALESSVADFPGLKPKWTGNPVRQAIFGGAREEAVRAFGLDPSAAVILAIGGGTGGARLNELVRGALPRLTAVANVIHGAGRGKTEGESRSPRYAQEELITDALPHTYAAADLVITRAGMGVLTELAALGKPAVIVPMAASHQEDNAAAFAAATGAPVIHERTVDPAAFADVVLGLLADKERLTAIGARMAALHRPDAAERIARMVLGTKD